ncbi:MAG: hypothetical protein OHK0045_16380 [Raineya sp.]
MSELGEKSNTSSSLRTEILENAINYQQSPENNVLAIKSVSEYKQQDTLISLVSYETKTKGERKIAIKSSIEKDGMVVPRWRIECEGCNQPGQCQLVGPISQYLECSSCSDGCAMNVTVLREIEQKTDANQETDENMDITKLAEESYEKTFKKKGVGVKVSSVEIIEDDIAKVYLVSYQDAAGKASTFSFMDYKQYSNKEPKKKKKIDCIGDCDCRERYILGSGTVECTCSPCEMHVTEF